MKNSLNGVQVKKACENNQVSVYNKRKDKKNMDSTHNKIMLYNKLLKDSRLEPF